MATPSRSLQASALTFALLSIGHTLGGKEWQSDPRFKSLARTRSWSCAKVGWYQGSAFFLITGILHYQWSHNPQALQDPLNRAMAGLVNALLWASSGWYFKNGVKDNGWAVGLSALWHAYSVVSNAF
ncbi:hypothetical protein N7510_005994 [Penicillium lagena]|uniref:uncharacterized protein n=1 Tax=Penicillium lagena TaxID=94218 RepID=UPI0025425C69|nr:uncharacterized protein N7510_005994 [Penicillium lagena]KAJ5612800.1 hypothetical protein N7510_005994 [Penicillium lagena]